jgi:hypothetical protein
MKRSWATGATAAAGLVGLRPGSVARAEDLLNASVRECARYVASLTSPPDPERTKLVAGIGALVVEHTAPEPSEGRCFEALLNVGRLALEAGETRLGRRVADTAMALRSGSGAAWRLRAEAAEAEGREKDAIDAYERCLRLNGHAEGGGEAIRGRLVALKSAVRGRATTIGVLALRAQLKGRSVCVVANGEGITESGLGEEIDAYDLVVRLDSFPTGHPGGTGERLGLHAVSHRCDGHGWRRQAEIRLVFGGERPERWRDAMNSRLVAGAQTYVGDETLSRPLRDAALIGEPRWATDASTAFTVTRLLDFLDVSPRIDLIGFTLPGQLRAEERQWVLAHARWSDGLRIALR